MRLADKSQLHDKKNAVLHVFSHSFTEEMPLASTSTGNFSQCLSILYDTWKSNTMNGCLISFTLELPLHDPTSK